MCGIMGFYCFSDKKPDKEKISTMFSLLESRGRDASGFAFIRDGNLIVNKAPVRSSEFVKSKDWQELELPKIMILHTRMKTQGSEKNPNNNHPLYNKEGIAIVHNGIIHNDHEIFGQNQVRDGEVDSEAVLSVLSSKGKGDKIKRMFDRIEGSFAVAVINKNEPDTLVLIKKDNPLDLYYHTDQDILYFCSEREIMQEALDIQPESKRGFIIGEKGFHFYEMENNHALALNAEGVESYKKYLARDFWNRNTYRGSSLDTIQVQCPWCLGQTRYFDGLLNNKCEHCGMKITEEELYNII
jgi:glucosamine 6-phosphate synthetase-like amidotransferase/phosphosugar isomerase protein